jgi:peptide/nickel transport system permease protein
MTIETTSTTAVTAFAPVATEPDDGAAGPASRPAKFRRRGRITMWLAIVWLAALTFTAVFASSLPYVKSDCSQFEERSLCRTHLKPNAVLAERPPAWATFSETTRPVREGSPERVGWFGTDTNGFDIFSRAMYGARNSLLIGALSILFGILIGGTLGLIGGYVGKRTDRVIDTLMNVLLAFPALLLAIFIVGFFGSSGAEQAESRSIGPIILALVILSIPPLARLVRANTMVYAQREFVTAARSIGAGNRRIIVREILPNVMPAMVTFAITGMAILIVAEGALAYLGLSVSAPTPTWGAMIFGGQQKLETAWWMSIMPSIVLFVTVLSINLLGDALSERFRVREAIG